MATEQDAARLRVLAARGELAEQVELLEASARAAVDFPAKIRRSPAKAAAIAAGVAFLAIKGPQRLFGTARRKARGKPEPLPSRMLPDEIEHTLRKLGSDGDKVRGVLERDFADYAKKAQKSRSSVRTLILLSVARPVLARTAKALADRAFSPSPQDFSTRLAQIRERAEEGRARGAKEAEGVEPAEASAEERLAVARGEDAADATSTSPAEESAPTGI